MSIPYRTRLGLRRFFVAIVVILVFTGLLLLCWFLWLNRYVVYSKDGAKLDFSLSVQHAPGEVPVQPDPYPTIAVHDKTPDDDLDENLPTELVRFSGYYVTVADLREDLDKVIDQLAALPKGSTIMLELKDVKSYVYYTSEHAAQKPDFDTARVDALVQQLQQQGHYIIAKIPAFQEYHYILENERQRVPYGLPHIQGNGSLWLDRSNGCYWMNPESDGTLTYLIRLIVELRGMGFDEVVLSDFRFPETDQIRFDGDKMQALTQAAATLVKTCSTDRFCLSFVRSSADLTLPEGRTRLYLTGVTAANADDEAAKTTFADPSIQVVFLTETADTRYEDFCVLRPIHDAH